MGDVVEVERALAMVKAFDPIQRVLLTCTGTLQGTLSAWFGGPMEIVVVEQTHEDEETFHRVIEMKHRGQCMMKADSVVTTERKDVMDLLLVKQLGLGQIMDTLGITPGFKLLEAGQDSANFWRVYELCGDGVTYRIKEVFPQCWYKTEPWRAWENP